jgi:hypothetical protein
MDRFVRVTVVKIAVLTRPHSERFALAKSATFPSIVCWVQAPSKSLFMPDKFTSNSKWRLGTKPAYKQGELDFTYSNGIRILKALLVRYFEGIQGDSAKQGELFGINNIFKLHEDKLATKMAVSSFSHNLY